MERGRFPFDDQMPDECRLLGKGLFGQVYDLGDGTVLKLALTVSTGIGSGCVKIQREWSALKALARDPAIAPLVPRGLSVGRVPIGSRLSAAGFSAWLHMEKIEGRAHAVSEVKQWSADMQRELGAAIGGAMAHLHLALKRLGVDEADAKADPYADIAEAVRGNRFYLDAIAQLRRMWALIPASELQFCHNDFNMSNLLFCGTQLCGILDFAEWGTSFREKDASDVLDAMPSLEAPLIAAYEREADMRLDRSRIALGLAENCLYSAVICDREGAISEAEQYRARLRQQLLFQ